MRKRIQFITVILVAVAFVTGGMLAFSHVSWATTTSKIQIGTYNLGFFTDLDPSTGA